MILNKIIMVWNIFEIKKRFQSRLAQFLAFLTRRFEGFLDALKRRPGPIMMAFLLLLFLAMVGTIIILGRYLPRCSSERMPCPIDEPGGCLCALRASDGTCWRRMSPALRCYPGSFTIKSGICLGYFETKLCGKSQADVDNSMSELSSALFNLHPNSDGPCNVSIVYENVRCRLPEPRQSTEHQDFFTPNCCRPPAPTCTTDRDCCNCGKESPSCAVPLSCMVTAAVGNVTHVPTECAVGEDACATFNYKGCSGEPTACLSDKLTVPYLEGLSSQCCNSTCKCRSACADEASIKACPCVPNTQGPCVRKMCLRTADYFAYGGVAQYLADHGASDVRICATNLCNRV